ncbi:uncharacterized protein CANTADRAFT_26352 [Suhomyces tanzawaensis NRRL Y-17324]|uniref:Uncharacterized protein n=1 Tax=Suhomyces tanzawaensis NRRL Y-17324 TaxID=984487 RepID=A0A1E4SIS1_9ASCO|nr:uncharacterized protein CANTADRAFT_26352 [Suhomyces tanzawaensis NRRL Y-17324]ODV79405.1 hypothetical protein CANTADRAFT_26352 [Suhomyces tanzawaensis NRRL Y-17324]
MNHNQGNRSWAGDLSEVATPIQGFTGWYFSLESCWGIFAYSTITKHNPQNGVSHWAKSLRQSS